MEDVKLEEMGEEIPVVIIEDEEGNEYYYEEEMVIPYDGKNFAILVALPSDEHGEDCGCFDDAEAIIARIDEVDGEAQYVAPTDEEYDAVAEIYDNMVEEEEEEEE